MNESKGPDKWCPMVRFVRDETGEVVGNRGLGTLFAFECIRGKCMAYRVVETIDGNVGHCGLAGKP